MTPAIISALLAATLIAAVLGVVAVRETARRSAELTASARGDDRPEVLREWRGRLNARARRTRWGRALDLRLTGAHLPAGPADFVVIVGATSLVVGYLLHGFMGNVGSALVVVAIVASALRWLEVRRQKRIAAFIEQLPDLARLLSNATSAGLALRRGVDLVVQELPDPAHTEFLEIQRQMSLGQSLNDTLADLNDRLPSRELDVLVRTLLIQSQAGGRLTTALNGIAGTLEDRRDLERELRTTMSGAIFSGYMVLMIGVGSVFLMNLVSPGSLDALTQNLIGQIVLAVAGVMFVLGFILIRRITRVTV
ncbi:type II secretion system F family protein [Serinicoccus kebangsaanensis]|uniref:type II secretion system F family protein n=1 Tax=Serinicoccus kebangsaanensis TaxID=2602069 RepID=UPI00124D91EB|nr:type II secretion system F family protein [Serinicoccus kebangsaanensis]